MTRAPFALLLLCLFPACLENQEEITVRPDGSLSVRVAVKGDAADLEEGHPLPAEGPWRADDDATARWRAGARPATEAERKEVRLAVEADFADTSALPSHFAPVAEPYRTAYLERAARLRVESRGARTVYVFERRLGARTRRAWDPSRRIEAGVPDEIRGRLERFEELSAAQWTAVAAAVRPAYEAMAAALVRDACLGVYVEGDAQLAVADLERITARARDEIGRLFTADNLRLVYEVLRRAREAKVAADPDPLARLEQETQQAVRRALAEELARTPLGAELRAGIRARLEWCLTAMNHTDDLADESFRITVHMPGVVVGGNFDERPAPATATFEFKGEHLQDRDVVLRVVSVVE